MRITADRNDLADAAGWAARALPSRPAMPILAGIRLHAGGDGDAELSAFDYDVSAQAVLADAQVSEPGTMVVPGRLLAQICRALPARPVTIAPAGDGRAELTCGRSSFTLALMPAGDYPQLPGMPPAAGTADAAAFAVAAGQAAVAASADDTLPAMTGVRVEAGEDTLTLTATDRYRLAVRQLEWKSARPGLDEVMLLPARVLADTARAMPSGELAIALGEGMAGLECGGRRVTCRLLGGEFPRTGGLLPQGWSAAAELDAEMLAGAVKRVALVAEPATPVRLTFSAGQLKLEAGAGDEAQAEETLEASFTGMSSLSVAFNAGYLLDGLGAAGADAVRLSFTEPGKPALLTEVPVPERAPEFRYVLMPVRLS